jgi:tetratricopeptide (TPR) repeat protein
MSASGASSAFSDLGFSALTLGDIETANQMFHNGLTSPTILGLVEKPRYLIGLGLVALAKKQSEDAAKYIQEARAYVEEHAMAYLCPFLDCADAQVSMARGDATRALELYTRAESRAVEMKMRPIVWQARAGAAKLLAAMGRTDEAIIMRQAARAMIDEIAGLFEDGTMRAAFVESAVKKIQ